MLYASLSAKISDCASDIADWARWNRLMLNSNTSEAIWCTTSRRQHQLPTAAIPITGVPITPARSVRDLGIYIDADWSLRAHVITNGIPRCSPPIVPDPPSGADSHVPDARSGSGTLTTRLYGIAVLVGIPAYLVCHLQSVLNAAGRFIYHLRPHDHISDALATLH